jgi:type IV secretion system protein VirB10
MRDLLKTAALSTLLGAGAELGTNGNQSDLVLALQRGCQESINQSGQQFVRPKINAQPTLTIQPERIIVREYANRDSAKHVDSATSLPLPNKMNA